jgi:hypothetical protein
MGWRLFLPINTTHFQFGSLLDARPYIRLRMASSTAIMRVSATTYKCVRDELCEADRPIGETKKARECRAFHERVSKIIAVSLRALS